MRFGISITALSATCPGIGAGRGAFVGELLAHTLQDPFGDGEFVPLGPHFRQLLGQLFFDSISPLMPPATSSFTNPVVITVAMA
ncbi:hypothetical protein ACFVYD_13270 [Streptomyces sp. NPDC058301]|uniref:hypothetical protein n=1 Tax=Streptomyces sp. NPDC058301 TaxID=3346436 RepID=UPI0036EF4A43